MGWSPNHGRVKERYRPTPTAREKTYHEWVMDVYDCVCGCGGKSTFVHHPLTRHPEQRWRRDHEYVVPMTDHCHKALHAAGDEAKFMAGLDEKAWQFRSYAYDAGVL